MKSWSHPGAEISLRLGLSKRADRFCCSSESSRNFGSQKQTHFHFSVMDKGRLDNAFSQSEISYFLQGSAQVDDELSEKSSSVSILVSIQDCQCIYALWLIDKVIGWNDWMASQEAEVKTHFGMILSSFSWPNRWIPGEVTLKYEWETEWYAFHRTLFATFQAPNSQSFQAFGLNLLSRLFADLLLPHISIGLLFYSYKDESYVFTPRTIIPLALRKR